MDNKAMYKLSYGLFVLSAAENGRDNGCIINTAVQVTTDPNRITIAVNKGNLTHDIITRTGLFTVSVLDVTTPFSVIQCFGFRSGRDADKFAECSTARTGNGTLRLTANANAFISARVISSTDLGTHTLFLAEVTDCEVLSDKESLTYAYYQANVKPKPERPKKKGFVCTVCGYFHEGDELPGDFQCPICGHGPSDFEQTEI
ncbi:MAG: flavin reductase [Clostridiales bacterium]|jgi:flavin reductase (DIM6/NTAB) family NADH-FMN oxidoreductase RutF|nr:flavin reductase [Clostridiales bacterium]